MYFKSIIILKKEKEKEKERERRGLVEKHPPSLNGFPPQKLSVNINNEEQKDKQ